MAVQASALNAFTFVGGLNTEGGYFVIPENSYVEGVNVVPQTDGSIERRTGIDYESGYSLFNSAITSDSKDLWAFTTGTWTTVAGDGNLDFFVVQYGYRLIFYSASSGDISPTKKSFSINLNSYRAPGNTEINGTAVCSFASTYGKLIVTSQNTIPLLVTYNVATDTLSVEKLNIKIRDFKGIPLITSSGVTVENTAEYTAAEWTALGVSLADVTYNLYNQGWKDEEIDAYRVANGGTPAAGPVAADPTNGKYPANTKSWIYGKDTSDDFDPEVLNKQDFGNSPAPKGHFIIDPFEDYAYRPSACGFFAGRVWYAGLPTSDLLGTVFFSQVLTDITKAPNAYQVNDPTSEVISDLFDDDGGTIEIPEAGEIVSLQPIGRGIMVFASNGVWFISNIDQGFTASSYTVEQVSNVGCTSAKSIVVVENTILYWNSNGIYIISPTNAVEYVAKNISEQAIKSFYKNIPTLSKLYAEGSYNATDKTIYWLFANQNVPTSSSGRYNKDAVLAFDLRLNAWYWFQLDTTTGVIPVSIEITKESSINDEEFIILSGTDTVVSGTDTVVAQYNTLSAAVKQYKLLCLHPVTSNNYSLTFADFINTRNTDTKFKDWYSYNSVGVEQQAYFITGYNLNGNGPARASTGQYLTVFMKSTETSFDASANPINESSCLMQSRWDFTNNTYPSKWSTDVEVYKHLRPFLVNGGATFDDGYPLVITKNKLRGRGKAVQFKFTSSTGKDMKLVGWTGTFVSNTNV